MCYSAPRGLVIGGFLRLLECVLSDCYSASRGSPMGGYLRLLECVLTDVPQLSKRVSNGWVPETA